MIVQVQQYGDFDILFTHSIWENKDYTSLEQTGLSSSLFTDDSSPEKAVAALKKLGFKQINTENITVGYNI